MEKEKEKKNEMELTQVRKTKTVIRNEWNTENLVRHEDVKRY